MEGMVSDGPDHGENRIYIIHGVLPPISESDTITKLAISELKDVFGDTFAVEPNPDRASYLINAHIVDRRKSLGLAT